MERHLMSYLVMKDTILFMMMMTATVIGSYYSLNILWYKEFGVFFDLMFSKFLIFLPHCYYFEYGDHQN